MQDIASQVAPVECRIDALQSSQQTLTILFVIALIVIAVLIGMLIATRSQRPPARHAPPLPPRPEPRVPQAAPAAAEPPRPAPAASAPAPAPAAADMPGALKPEIAAGITASVAAFLAAGRS